MAKRRVTTFTLAEEIQLKLQRANLKTVEDVLSHSFLQLMILLQLSASETQNLIFCLSSACLPQCYRGYDLLEKEIQNGIGFGDCKLDQILQGGIKRGTLTEFTGPSGVGKTQLCLHLALKCLQMRSLQNAVCFIDTEGTFRSERLLEMLQDDQEIAGKKEELPSKFHVLQPKTVASLSEILKSLELFCIEREVGMVVIDSVASLARKEFSQDSRFHRAATLSSWAAQFKALADQLKIAVIVTNQVTSRVSKDESSDEDEDRKDDRTRSKFDLKGSHFIIPALGTTWTHFVNTRFILQFLDSDVRQLIIAKSPIAPVAVKNYRVTPAGIEFTGELNYTFSGMNPNKHRIKAQPAFM